MLECANCGKELKGNQKKFCCLLCLHLYRKGKTYEDLYGKEKAESISNKIGNSRIGKYGGENHPMWNRHQTEESNRKNSESQKGEKHWNFGGHLPEEQKEKIRLKTKGKKRSEETREKIRLARTGTHASEEARQIMRIASKGDKNGMFNKKHSEEAIRKMRESTLGKYAMEKNPNWQGGKSFEEYPKEFNKAFKEMVRKRDGYTCQECGYTEEQLGYRLTCHHADYDKHNNDPLNMTSLCKSCHGKTNFDRNNWTKYYRDKTLKAEQNKCQLSINVLENQGQTNILEISTSVGQKTQSLEEIQPEI